MYKLFLDNLKHKNPNLFSKDSSKFDSQEMISLQFGSYKDDEQIGYLSNNLLCRSAAAISCGGADEPTFEETQSWYKAWNFQGKLKKVVCERNNFMEKSGKPENVIPIEALYNLYGDDIFKCGCD